MRILIGDADIQDRLMLQRHLGTFGDCQTVESTEALLRVFHDAATGRGEERFKLVVVAGNLEQPMQIFDEIRTIEIEADVDEPERCIVAFTGNLVEWMSVSCAIADSCNTFLAKPLRRELLHTAMANLGFAHIRKKTCHAAEDATACRFIESQGEILVLADNPTFYNTLKRCVDALDTRQNPTHLFTVPENLQQHLSLPMRSDVDVLLFLARRLNGKYTTDLIRRLRELHQRLKVIVFTDESEDFSVAHLHDVDADNVLTLPASHNNLFEKIDNTLRPPTKLQGMLQEARIALGSGDHRQALTLLEEALELKPFSPGVLMLKGDVLREMGDVDGAISAYEDAHLSSSLYIEPLKRLVEIHRKRSPELALAYMEKLDAISPGNARRKVEIGNAKLETDGIETSKRYYDQGIELAQKESGRLLDELVGIISQALRFRFPKVALGYIDALIKTKRGKYTEADLETFNQRGVLLRQEGNWKEAIANYRKALAISPHNLVLQYNLMMAFLEGKDFKAALNAANAIMEADPAFARTSANTAYNLAGAYRRRGRADQALALLNIALEIDPEHAPSLKLQHKLASKEKKA